MANSRLCSVDNCDKPAASRGYCNSHYERAKRHGSPTAGRAPNGEQWQYLLDHMGDDCPKWPYYRSPTGRGRVYDPTSGKKRFAHQIVCEMMHGPRPSPNHEAAHNCGLGHEGCFGAYCVEWKTREANQMDRVGHGTSNRGHRHGSSRLTEDQVRTIRAMDGAISQSALGRRFGVSRETVRDIQNRRIWAWLD